MMTKNKCTGRLRVVIWSVTLLAVVVLFLQPKSALAQTCQWTSGTNTITQTCGNVGIGTLSPSEKVHLFSSSAGTVLRQLFQNTSSTGYIEQRFLSDTNADFRFGLGGSANAGFGGNMAYITTVTSHILAFGTVNTERMRIDTSGHVGIGTTSPRGLFDVVGTGDIYLATDTIGGTGQSLYLPGHIYLAPLVGSNVSYLQARRSNDSGSTELQIRTTNAGSIIDAVRINSAGNVGIGTTSPSSTLHVVGNLTLTGTGNISATGNIAAKYQDVAEWVPASRAIPAGTVVILDAEQSNHVLPSSSAYDTRVAGVISAKPGVILGEGGDGKVMVATIGRVRVKVDATNAPIRVGDLLVTSDKEGIAMRSQPLDLGGTPIHRPGTLIGKALEPLDKGVGEILVLLSLQ
jgi:hypothetical protein